MKNIMVERPAVNNGLSGSALRIRPEWFVSGCAGMNTQVVCNIREILRHWQAKAGIYGSLRAAFILFHWEIPHGQTVALSAKIEPEA